MLEIIPSSPKALEKITDEAKARYNESDLRPVSENSVYPWASVPLGYSFAVVPTEDFNITYFRTQASAAGRRLNRKFAVVTHHFDIPCTDGQKGTQYEVARIA